MGKIVWFASLQVLESAWAHIKRHFWRIDRGGGNWHSEDGDPLAVPSYFYVFFYPTVYPTEYWQSSLVFPPPKSAKHGPALSLSPGLRFMPSVFEGSLFAEQTRRPPQFPDPTPYLTPQNHCRWWSLEPRRPGMKRWRPFSPFRTFLFLNQNSMQYSGYLTKNISRQIFLPNGIEWLSITQIPFTRIF